MGRELSLLALSLFFAIVCLLELRSWVRAQKRWSYEKQFNRAMKVRLLTAGASIFAYMATFPPFPQPHTV